MATNTRKLASLLGASGAGIADDGTLTSTAIGEVIVASDIAAGAVGSSEIATGAVTATELADNAVDAGAIAADAIPVKPHIQPGTLCPAVAGKLLDGTTSHSGAYGTAQSDGKSYYYTDIKGSKPIKDPRIGAHFGSQRHKFKSLQLLEQETATHGDEVYSVDGREWIRVVGASAMSHGNHGLYFPLNAAGEYIEITGYFNDANVILLTGPGQDIFNLHLNGTSLTDAGIDTVSASPLMSRYVDDGSVVNIAFSTTPTLGINTIKITYQEWIGLFGIELIAQDTSNVNNIQIPSQNVVSYGKKFTVSGTPHYDPFNGFTNSTTLHSAVVDTATSLGLSTAPGSSASWAISGSNNIRPYNGGRVVKWVDSSGVIKTSVNMMPPNAQNILGTVAGTTEVTTPSATNATYTPIFSDDAIDHSQAEVAKTFHWREFGNGSSNQGTGGTTRAADASMLSGTADDIAYVMDDGLTSLSGDDMEFKVSKDLGGAGSGDIIYITFIGTGIGKTTTVYSTNDTIAQNLPYGTHILGMNRQDDNGGDPDITIDGVAFTPNLNDYGYLSEITFYQPKRPPIPEDAVVIADYMLMADFVVQGAGGNQNLSKGTRYISASRDIFYNGSGSKTLTTAPDAVNYRNLHIDIVDHASNEISVPAFGTHCLASGYNMNADAPQWQVNNSNVTGVGGNGAVGGSSSVTPAQTLGNNKFEFGASGIGSNMNFDGFFIASPIHTSSHYQTFETPFLRELVGGDRNMEQTNLVVTPDGKTWDEVTRDTSYIGNMRLHTTNDVAVGNATDAHIFDEWRGSVSRGDNFNKDFAIGYDRMICLVDGQYNISFSDYDDTNFIHRAEIWLNGVRISSSYGSLGSGYSSILLSLKRGDYLQGKGNSQTSGSMSVKHFLIERI